MLYKNLLTLGLIKQSLNVLILEEGNMRIRTSLVLARLEIDKATTAGLIENEDYENQVVEDDGGPTEEDLGNNLDILA